MLKWISVLLILDGCATQKPTAPIDRNIVVSGGHQQVSIDPSPLFHHGVTWDYAIPIPADNIAFDVEASTNLTDWYLIVTTNQPPVSWDDYNPTEYVRCGAHWIIPEP
jgi:hypothetical protein